MQAILLSAGRGQRLAPLTDTLPKPLIEVGGKALIDYQLERLAAAGAKKVIINSGWLGQKLINHVGTGNQFGLRVVYSIEPQEALETAGGIIQALPLMDDEQFIVCNADVFHEYDFAKLSTIKLKHAHAHVVLINNPEHNRYGDFILSEKCVFNKTMDSKYTLTYSGIGLYHKAFFIGLKQGPRKLGALLRTSTKVSKVSGEIFSDTWFDAGTQERLQNIEEYLQNSDLR